MKSKRLALLLVFVLVPALALAQGGFFGGFAEGLKSGQQYGLQRQQLELQRQQMVLQQAPLLFALRDKEFEQEARVWASTVQELRAAMGQEPLSVEELTAKLERSGAMLWETQYKQSLLK